jgi:hypothetical protein
MLSLSLVRKGTGRGGFPYLESWCVIHVDGLRWIENCIVTADGLGWVINIIMIIIKIQAK